MDNYAEEINRITVMLTEFIKNGKIDTDRLDLIDKLTKLSTDGENKLLNSGYYPLEIKTALFGMLMDIINISEVMKESLMTAHARGENPTTADRALELMPSFHNLIPYVNSFSHNARFDREDIERVNSLTRILHVKSKKLGFSKDADKQLEEAKINPEDVKEFIEGVKTNISTKLEIEID